MRKTILIGMWAAACAGDGGKVNAPTIPKGAVAAAPGASASFDDKSGTVTDGSQQQTQGSNSPAIGPSSTVATTTGSQSPINAGQGTQNITFNNGPPPDRCAHHEIRSQDHYNTCLKNCERKRQEAYDNCKDDPCRGGVNNAKPGCDAACAGKMRVSRDDGCCPGCE